ncbi:Fe-S oxidoreductase [Labilithrix luteola]|uniref:Fe-S oxidoreductase n=1 Tax=Labilithrix luteola TaxID=1391654 RepID=A0A0K1QAL7_9BACT|nr:PEGA domain-containing protein [Labilithrix luteola]AKV02773.1 Fe-S oxidoreductase [Labilithrix luteola]
MKILGNSRGVASVIAVAIGLAVAPASAQIAPTAGPVTTAPPPKPTAAPTAPGAKPTPAAAKPTAPAAGTAPAAKPADAKALFASGEKKFKAADYAGALADFEASNAAKAAPETQRYIALSQDNLQHYSEAVAAFEKFIADAPAKSKDQVEEAKKRVEAIKALPGKVHVDSVPPGATVTVDPPANAQAAAPAAPGAQPAAQPAPAPAAQPAGNPTPTDLELAPGKHTIRLAAEGYETADKDVDVTFGSKQDLKVDLVKKAEPPPPPPPPPVASEAAPAAPAAPPPPPVEPRSKIPAYVTGAVALVAAGVGTGFGIAALSQSNDFNNHPNQRTTKLADDGENNALVADMMFGIAITFGVTSAVLFLSSDQPATAKASSPTKTADNTKKKSSITVTPTPYVSPTGGGAGVNVRF